MLGAACRWFILALAIALPGAMTLQAQPADPLAILEGRTIRFIIGGTPAGTTDSYARPFFDGLKALLPRSTVVAQNIQGGAGVLGLVEAATASPGVITMVVIQSSVVGGQVIGSDSSAVDIRPFHAIGSFTHDQRVMTVRAGLGLPDFAALAAYGETLMTPVVLENSATHVEALLLSAFFPLRLEIIVGVDDDLRQSLVLAGDSDLHSNSWRNLANLIEGKVVVPVLRWAKDGYPPELDSIPTFADLVPSTVPAAVAEVEDSINRLGRFVLAAPATDPAIVDALRVAFDRVMTSPALISAYDQADLVLVPTGGEEMQRRLDQLLKDEAAIAAFRAAVECGRARATGAEISCLP
ncbi:MAG: hypothetical protein IT535_14970 [Bauldia sp.]|nr:hypothetical protein [Bauldia sp.]